MSFPLTRCQANFSGDRQQFLFIGNGKGGGAVPPSSVLRSEAPGDGYTFIPRKKQDSSSTNEPLVVKDVPLHSEHLVDIHGHPDLAQLDTLEF